MGFPNYLAAGVLPDEAPVVISMYRGGPVSKHDYNLNLIHSTSSVSIILLKMRPVEGTFLIVCSCDDEPCYTYLDYSTMKLIIPWTTGGKVEGESTYVMDKRYMINGHQMSALTGFLSIKNIENVIWFHKCEEFDVDLVC